MFNECSIELSHLTDASSDKYYCTHTISPTHFTVPTTTSSKKHDTHYPTTQQSQKYLVTPKTTDILLKMLGLLQKSISHPELTLVKSAP